MNDFIIFEDKKLIISTERFYDNLKLLQYGEEQFKRESKIKLSICLDECEKHLSNGFSIVLKNNNENKVICKSKSELIGWLESKTNIELGTGHLNGLNKNVIICAKD